MFSFPVINLFSEQNVTFSFSFVFISRRNVYDICVIYVVPINDVICKIFTQYKSYVFQGKMWAFIIIRYPLNAIEII